VEWMSSYPCCLLFPLHEKVKEESQTVSDLAASPVGEEGGNTNASLNLLWTPRLARAPWVMVAENHDGGVCKTKGSGHCLSSQGWAFTLSAIWDCSRTWGLGLPVLPWSKPHHHAAARGYRLKPSYAGLQLGTQDFPSHGSRGASSTILRQVTKCSQSSPSWTFSVSQVPMW
jgi:hypothetical protein